jgi:hypothetical protein
MANKEREQASMAVESMVASLQKQIEGVDIQEVSKLVSNRPAGDEALAINSFGTAGTAGSLTGCFGTAGTFGSLGATEVVAARKS